VPHVVLIDAGGWDEAGQHALRVLDALRQRTAWFVIAVHVARDGHLDPGEALALGADLYLLKGLRTADLVSHVIRCRLGATIPKIPRP
jgi:DNA-binding NarL/FixJ family response regulator